MYYSFIKLSFYGILIHNTFFPSISYCHLYAYLNVCFDAINQCSNSIPRIFIYIEIDICTLQILYLHLLLITTSGAMTLNLFLHKFVHIPQFFQLINWRLYPLSIYSLICDSVFLLVYNIFINSLFALQLVHIELSFFGIIYSIFILNIPVYLVVFDIN